MKHKPFILWITSLFLTFIVLYYSNLNSDYYPVTSTINIDGKKVTYRFEKVHYGNDDVKIIIRTDLEELSGKLFWKNDQDKNWSYAAMKKSGLFLAAEIPALKPLKSSLYFVKLNYKDFSYNIPDNQNVKLDFYGKIPIALNILEMVLLYTGLFLSIRAGLEYFNNNTKTKKLAVMIVIIFITLTLLINPLYQTYKLGFMNTTVPALNEIFPVFYWFITLMWIVTSISIFRFPKIKLIAAASSIITALYYMVERV